MAISTSIIYLGTTLSLEVHKFVVRTTGYADMLATSIQTLWMRFTGNQPKASARITPRVIAVIAILVLPAALPATDRSIVVPLLHHVFFDSADCSLPVRYAQLVQSQVATFTLDSTQGQTDYKAYRHILNIVGYRLSKNPNWRVSLASVSHGEAIPTSLMECRTETIRSYLVDVWKVDSSQISVTKAPANTIRYNPKKDCGNRANWRVDLIPSNDSLLYPLSIPVNQDQSSQVVLEVSLLPWDPDSDNPLHSLRYVFDVLRANAAQTLNGRCVVHGDSAQRSFSHWYYLDAKRARKHEQQLGVDTVVIDWQQSRHYGCAHRLPEECLYRRAMYVEYTPK